MNEDDEAPTAMPPQLPDESSRDLFLSTLTGPPHTRSQAKTMDSCQWTETITSSLQTR